MHGARVPGSTGADGSTPGWSDHDVPLRLLHLRTRKDKHVRGVVQQCSNNRWRWLPRADDEQAYDLCQALVLNGSNLGQVCGAGLPDET